MRNRDEQERTAAGASMDPASLPELSVDELTLTTGGLGRGYFLISGGFEVADEEEIPSG